MPYTEEELYRMSDEELEKAMRDEEIENNSSEVDGDIETGGSIEEPPADDTDDYEEDELEQPEEDNQDSDEDNEQLEENGEELESQPDQDSEQEAAKEDNQSKPTEEKYKFKANGQEFEFTKDELVSQFGKVFGQAMNYTKKMQAIAPYRKMISAIEDEGLNQDDINLYIDAIKGNKDAVAQIVKKANVDLMNIDTEEESNYVPNSYGKNENELKIQEVIEEIGADPEFAVTQNVITNQWDEQSRAVFAEQPELIKELHIDVANGTFDKVNQMATKLKVLDGGRRSDLDYYLEAGRQYHSQQKAAMLGEQAKMQQEQQLQEQQKISEIEQKQKARESIKSQSKRKKAAAPTNTMSGKNKVIDYLDDSDEAFEEWYRKIQEKY